MHGEYWAMLVINYFGAITNYIAVLAIIIFTL